MNATSTTSPPLPVPLRTDANVIGLVGLAHACSHFSHMLLPLMFPLLARDFGWSYSQMGVWMTAFFVVSGAGQASAGFVVDKLGARPVLMISMGLFIAACTLASVADSYATFIAVAVLLGMGNASFHPVDFSILNQRVSAPRLGYAFSAHGLTGSLGWAGASIFMVSIAAAYDWRHAYAAAAALIAAVLVLLWVQRAHLVTLPTHLHDAQGAKQGDFAFMKLSVVWWCFGFFFLSTMTLSVIQNYSVPILKGMYEIDLAVAAKTVTAYMLASALGMLVGGWVAARFPRRSDLIVALCMGVGAVCLALCATGWLGATACMVVLSATGLAVGIGGPSRDMMIKRATPKGATGRVYGTVYSGLDVGFAVSPLLFGVLMDHAMYPAALAGAALTLLVSVFTAIGVGARTAKA